MGGQLGGERLGRGAGRAGSREHQRRLIEQVLAEPPKSGFDLTAWLVPGLAILVAAAAIAVGLWRWRRAGRAREATAAPENTLDASERERLDSDLSRYDL